MEDLLLISASQASWFSTHLLKWYAVHGRHDLPWKKPLSAYRVWVSEIMLQQTQVATVIPYFEKFMKAFPTVAKLAGSPLDKVLHHWAGLGYYARARNLHKSAILIVEKFQGKFPRTVAELVTLPGIGRSTAGAILSQAFNKRAPILDGNVKRVLTRFHCFEGYPGEKSIEQTLWEIADCYTPSGNAADYTQAIMDLGATLCTRTAPRCTACPLHKRCQAYQTQTQLLFPFKKPSKTLPTRDVTVLCLTNTKKEILLEQRPQKGIWGGLWSLPEFSDRTVLGTFLKKHLGAKFPKQQPLPHIHHTFTHFHLNIAPVVVKSSKLNLAPAPFTWVSAKQLAQLGLPAPIKRLLNSL